MITYDTQLIQTRALFEQLTGAETKDCFLQGDKLLILVQPGQMGKALGKHKSHALHLSRMLKKKIHIVEYHENPLTFIKNLLQPLTADRIEEENGIVTIHAQDPQTKAYIIGAQAQNLKRLTQTVQHYHPIQKIRVV